VTLSHEETYYIHILNVSPVFAESVFLMTRRVFAESVFAELVFLLTRHVIAELVFVELGFADEARCLSVYVWGVVMLCVCCVYLRVLFAFNTFAKTYVVL